MPGTETKASDIKMCLGNEITCTCGNFQASAPCGGGKNETLRM